MTDTQPAPTIPHRSPSRLIGLNLVLLLILAVVTMVATSRVDAQPGAPAQPSAGRGRGEYTMVSGRYQGGTANAIYVVDSVNQQVLGLLWDRNRNDFSLVGLRKLADDAKFKQGR